MNPVYAIVDRRQDGAPRIVGEYTDPDAARQAAMLMRSAGSPVAVVQVTATRDESTGVKGARE